VLVTTPALSDELFATFGKIDLGGFCDPNVLANDETMQFLYGGFANSAAFEAPDPGSAVVFSCLHAASWDEATDELFACLQLGPCSELGGRTLVSVSSSTRSSSARNRAAEASMATSRRWKWLRVEAQPQGARTAVRATARTKRAGWRMLATVLAGS
jgi:hypothetical protein